MKLYGVLYKYFPDEEHIVDDKLYRERVEAEKRMDEFGLAKNAEQQYLFNREVSDDGAYYYDQGLTRYSIKEFDIDIEDFIENRISLAVKNATMGKF